MNAFQSCVRSSSIAVSKPSCVVAMLSSCAVRLNLSPKLLRWLEFEFPSTAITRLVFFSGLLTDTISGLDFAFSYLCLYAYMMNNPSFDRASGYWNS